MSNLPVNSKLQEFEHKLKELIENPTPQPQYELWQTIRWKRYGLRADMVEEKQGRIAGFYFISVGIGFQDSSDPGWYYHIESGFGHTIVHEDDVAGGIE